MYVGRDVKDEIHDISDYAYGSTDFANNTFKNFLILN